MVKFSYSVSLLALTFLTVAVFANPVETETKLVDVVKTEPEAHQVATSDDTQDDIDALTKGIAALEVSEPYPYHVGKADNSMHLLRADPRLSPQIRQVNWDIGAILTHLDEKDPTSPFYCIRNSFKYKEQGFIKANGSNKGFLRPSSLGQHISDKKLVIGYIRSDPTGPLEVKVLYNPLRYSTNIVSIVENEDDKRFMMYIAYNIHKQKDKTLYMDGLKRLMQDLLDANTPNKYISKEEMPKLYPQGIPLVLDMIKTNTFRTLTRAELTKA
ncbi:hypothetical protein H4R35_005132 [Dimargaris xerosporica]|nr:hypothetical protein H4R35_005132 [Dimargaris xerosporica]